VVLREGSCASSDTGASKQDKMSNDLKKGRNTWAGTGAVIII
jgi:hypothetical protein